jgi:hypothetical protein
MPGNTTQVVLDEVDLMRGADTDQAPAVRAPVPPHADGDRLVRRGLCDRRCVVRLVLVPRGPAAIGATSRDPAEGD